MSGEEWSARRLREQLELADQDILLIRSMIIRIQRCLLDPESVDLGEIAALCHEALTVGKRSVGKNI
jgi:hypothetical protein